MTVFGLVVIAAVIFVGVKDAAFGGAERRARRVAAKESGPWYPCTCPGGRQQLVGSERIGHSYRHWGGCQADRNHPTGPFSFPFNLITIPMVVLFVVVVIVAVYQEVPAVRPLVDVIVDFLVR